MNKKEIITILILICLMCLCSQPKEYNKETRRQELRKIKSITVSRDGKIINHQPQTIEAVIIEGDTAIQLANIVYKDLPSINDSKIENFAGRETAMKLNLYLNGIIKPTSLKAGQKIKFRNLEAMNLKVDIPHRSLTDAMIAKKVTLNNAYAKQNEN